MRISWAIQVVAVVCLVAHSAQADARVNNNALGSSIQAAEIEKANHFPIRYGLVKRGEDHERPRARPGPSRTPSSAPAHRGPDHHDDNHDGHHHPPGKKPTPAPSKGKPVHKNPDHKHPHKPDHKPTKEPTKSTGKPKPKPKPTKTHSKPHKPHKPKPKPTKTHSKPHKPHKPTSSSSKPHEPKPTGPSNVVPPVAPSPVAPPPVVSPPPTVPTTTGAPVAPVSPVAPGTSPSDGSAGSSQTVQPTPALVSGPPSQAKMSGDSASSVGTIIGALVGTIALVGLVALGVYRRREKKRAIEESLAPGPDDGHAELEAPRTAFRHESFMALVKDAASGFYAPGTPGAEAAAANGGAPVYVARAGSGLAGELSRQNSGRSQNSQRSHHTLHNRRSGSYSPNGSMNGVTPGAMPPLAHLGGRS